MKHISKFIPIIVIIIIIIIITIIFFLKKNGNIYEKLFNNTTSDLNNIGGMLVNNFGPVWFEKFLSVGDITLNNTSVCASVNRQTCTAYSYIRKDLIPMFFQFPGIALNVPCGIILNPHKVWPLITLMAVVDADTNVRSSCTNDSYSAFFLRNPFTSSQQDKCISNTLLSKYGPNHDYVKNKYAVYIPQKDMGASYKVSCNGDLNCMYNNSGGNINIWTLINSPDCLDGRYKDCFEYSEATFEEVPPEIKAVFSQGSEQPYGYLKQSMKQECPICLKPYLCVTSDFNNTDKYKTVVEDNRIATYIGKDGLGFEKITNTVDIGSINISQCRFEKKDWNVWIKVLKNWYKTLLNVLKPDNSLPDKLNYMLGNPNSPSYFENEVNLYINPDTSSDEFKKQNEIWQDSIIGFYYTGIKCEDQFKELDGIKTNANGDIFTSNIDRCDGFWKLDDNSINSTEKRREWETKNMIYSRSLVKKVTNLFNKKYNKNVPLFKSTASSNAFPSYKDIIKAQKEKVKFSDIFQEDIDP